MDENTRNVIGQIKLVASEGASGAADPRAACKRILSWVDELLPKEDRETAVMPPAESGE